MALEALMKEVSLQEALVMEMTDRLIISTALRLAYYTAMLDAANDDPLDSYDDQEEICNKFTAKIEELTWKFQDLVNEKL